jgi:hypothetical protein
MMITTHPTLNNARLAISKNHHLDYDNKKNNTLPTPFVAKKHNVSTYVLKIRNRRLLNTTPKQHGSKSFRGGMTKKIP